MESADRIARSTSLGLMPEVSKTDTNSLTWREVDSGPDGFEIGQDVPANSTVLVALSLERTTEWDPHVRVHLGSPFSNAMYVDGEPLWDNYERRPIDFPNPPMVDKESLVIMRIDGQNSMSIELSIEAPSGAIALPMEGGVVPVLTP